MCLVMLLFLSFYNLLIEIPLMINRKLEWFTSASSLVNTLLNVLLTINNLYEDSESHRFWIIQMWAALLIWMRFLLYLRTFEKFSWMIRLIQQSLYDMRYFIFVFFFIVFAFADSFLSIAELLKLRQKEEAGIDTSVADEPTEDKNVYETYFKTYIGAIKMSYLTSLGEFADETGDYEDYEWLIFFLSTIINVIVMLNALIALTGETFSEIYANQVSSGYREKVYQIVILQNQLKWIFNDGLDPNARLFVAQKTIAGVNNKVGPSVTEQVQSLKTELRETKVAIEDFIDDKLQKMAEVIQK